jgi:hypothetical protein
MFLAFHPSLNLVGLQMLFLEFISKPGAFTRFKSTLKKDKDQNYLIAYSKMKARLKQKLKSRKTEGASSTKSGRRFFSLSNKTQLAALDEAKDDFEELSAYFKKIF